MNQPHTTSLATRVHAVALCETAKERTAATLVAGLVALAVGLGAGALWYLVNGATSIGVWYNKYFMLFVAVAVFCGLLFWVFRCEVKERPDTLFLLLVLTITVGTSLLYDINMVSWDPGHHFVYMLEWLSFGRGPHLMTGAEESSYFLIENTIHTSIEGLAEWKNQLIAQAGSSVNYAAIAPANMLARLSALPASLVYALCTALGLSFPTCYLLAKLPYAVIYSLLCWAAMRQLKSGKMILASVAMVPVALFLCESYGYDYWVNGFTLLGVAAVVGVIQRPHEKVTLGKAALILGAFFLAYLPKFVYAPLVLIAFLIPASRFKSKREAWAFRACCVGVIVLVAVALFLPSFLKRAVATGSAGTGDTRGGSDVNASLQIGFVVNNFGYYVFGVLLPFLLTYLAPWNADRWLGLHGYLGTTSDWVWLLSLALLVFVCLTDKGECDRQASHWWDRVWAGVLCFGVLAVAASALYVDFTAVGSDTIAGFQGRYFIPFLFIILYFMGIPSVGIKLRPKVPCYNALVLGLLSAIALGSTWMMYVSLIA